MTLPACDTPACPPRARPLAPPGTAHKQTAPRPGGAFASPEDSTHVNFTNRIIQPRARYNLCFRRTEGT